MGSLANAYGADKTSVLNGWVHPAERPAQPPRTEVLYGREWSAADAAYARELMANEGLTAADLARLWATNRPSVRVATVKPEPECKAPTVKPEPVPALQPEPARVPLEVTAFERWFAGSGLSISAAAARLGVTRPTIYAWRQKGAPAEVMSKLEG